MRFPMKTELVHFSARRGEFVKDGLDHLKDFGFNDIFQKEFLIFFFENNFFGISICNVSATDCVDRETTYDFV